MFRHRNGEIVPGERIGGICLGMGAEALKEMLREFKVYVLPDYEVLIGEDIKIWIGKEEDVVMQILAYGEFAGEYGEEIGIGSTLADVQNRLHMAWHEDLDTYVLDDVPGMCFELGDSGDDTDWDEMTAPIEMISVYPKEGFGAVLRQSPD